VRKSPNSERLPSKPGATHSASRSPWAHRSSSPMARRPVRAVCSPARQRRLSKRSSVTRS
jgi:hypothetical protein